MQKYYNMNQTTLSIALDYLPEENHPVRYINQLVENLKLTYTYQFGRPREYFKAKQRDLLSTSQTAATCAQRKIDVEPIFGKMKASLRFHRFSVSGLDRARKEARIVIMALNIRKLVTLVTNSKSRRIG